MRAYRERERERLGPAYRRRLAKAGRAFSNLCRRRELSFPNLLEDVTKIIQDLFMYKLPLWMAVRAMLAVQTVARGLTPGLD